MEQNLLNYKKNIFSQNGEDGIIEQIFQMIGDSAGRVCCEFGAWDGVHLSNTRNLILKGWTAVMIEGEKERFGQLKRNYQDNPRVHGICAFVDTGENSLSKLLKKNGLAELAGQMDFLSIDIDGLDYEIFSGLDITPKVICVEVNAGHDPEAKETLPQETAKNNVGQPLSIFSSVAGQRGYGLICYTGNAFYMRNDVIEKYGFVNLSGGQAYEQFLASLNKTERFWLYLVNKGMVEPFHKFHNPYLSRKNLKLGYFLSFLQNTKWGMRKLFKVKPTT